MAKRSNRTRAEVMLGRRLNTSAIGSAVVGAVAILIFVFVAGRTPPRGAAAVAGASGFAVGVSASPLQTSLGPVVTSAPTLEGTSPTSAGTQDALVSLGIAADPDPRLLYDVADGGSWSAYRDQWDGPGPLHLAKSGGPVVDLNLGPTDLLAPQAAAFSPDGGTLAVVDGAGALWTVDVGTAKATLIEVTGPLGLVFGRSVRFGDQGHLYVGLVGSVEMPLPGRIGVVSLSDGTVTLLSDDESAFGPRALDDGSVAYLHLNDDGSYVARRIGLDRVVTDIAQVGFAHGWVDISSTGIVAFSDGANTYLVSEAGGKPVSISAGAYPRFARDGSALVIYDSTSETSRLIGLDGVLIAAVDSPFVAITTCSGSC
jgi:hypothetical protein